MAHASLVKLAYNKVEKIKRVKKDHVEQPQHQEASIRGLFKKCDLSSTSVGRETDSHLAPHVVRVRRLFKKCDLSSTSVGRETDSHLAPHVVTVLGDSQSEVRRFLF